MAAMLNIKTCPSCGSKRIRRVRKALVREARGRKYVVPSLEFHECPDCGERLFGRDTMRRIEACSAACSEAGD
jgi:YgiT-type zinc finger domain-containing protein